MPTPVIDPAISGPMALAGRIVTMDDRRTVLDRGVLYARDGAIVDVRPVVQPAPPGFEQVHPVATGGTMFPGLIELHNHLPYGVLQLWQVPKRYGDRDQWSGTSTPDYHRLISGPMGVLGRDVDAVPAIVRYVELRCLLGGTTTSQGVALASDAGIVKHFRGLVRNVESTGDPELRAAATHIADVDATDAEHFLARISGTQKLLLHLSEGTDPAARRHFQALQIDPGRWAITANLIGIHCVGLTDADFAVFADHGGSMVWSPLSNLLLYGQTAALGAALARGVPVALGSDWAPSGSKNLLGELKAARLAAPGAGAQLSGADLVAMATRTPARLLGWGDHLGSLEPGKRADVVVVDGTGGDPYDSLIDATERDLTLVVINGVPRVGTPALMAALGTGGASGAGHGGHSGETVEVGGQQRTLDLTQATADPDVAAVSAAHSVEILTAALTRLWQPGARRVARSRRHGLRLAVADVIDNHMSSRPHLPFRGRLTGPNLPGRARRAARRSGPFPALTLDPLTAVDNPGYYRTLAAEPNLPAEVRAGLVPAGLLVGADR